MEDEIPPVENPKQRRIVSFSRWNARITPVEPLIPAVESEKSSVEPLFCIGGNRFQAADGHFSAVEMSKRPVETTKTWVELLKGNGGGLSGISLPAKV